MIKDIVPQDVLIEAKDLLDYSSRLLEKRLEAISKDLHLTVGVTHALAEVSYSIREMEELSAVINSLLMLEETDNHWAQVEEAINIALEASEESLQAANAMIRLGKVSIESL